MSQLLTWKISRIDHAISLLMHHRRRCSDPLDILRATESIDEWLDERLVLMQDRDRRRERV